MLWHETANPGGLFDVRMMRDLSVITAAGVGGGSLVYANVQLRAPADVFERDWPAAISRKELDPWYDRTEEALQPRETPAEPELPKVRAFAAAGRHVGKEADPLPLAVHFGEAAGASVQRGHAGGLPEPRPLRPRLPRAREEHGRHHLLARAETHGAEVRPLHLVGGDRTAAVPGGTGRRLQEPRRAARTAPSRRRPSILAAGTIGSSRLLLEEPPPPARALARARQPLLRQRRCARDRLRPERARRPGARNDYGPVDDEQARLHAPSAT